MKIFNYALILFISTILLNGTIISVMPGESIQDAIDNEGDLSGKTMLLYDGNYNGDINISIPGDFRIQSADGNRPIINGNFVCTNAGNSRISLEGLNFGSNKLTFINLSFVSIIAVSCGDIYTNTNHDINEHYYISGSQIIISDSIIGDWNLYGGNCLAVGLRTAAQSVNLNVDNCNLYFGYGSLNRLVTSDLIYSAPNSVASGIGVLTQEINNGNNKIVLLGNEISNTVNCIFLECAGSLIEILNNRMVASQTTWSSGGGIIFDNSTSRVLIQNNTILTPSNGNYNHSAFYLVYSNNQNSKIKYNEFIGRGFPIYAPSGTLVESNSMSYHYGSYMNGRDFVIGGGAQGAQVFQDGYYPSNESNKGTLNLTWDSRYSEPNNFNTENLNHTGDDLLKTTIGFQGGPFASIEDAVPYEQELDPITSEETGIWVVKPEVKPVLIYFNLSNQSVLEGDTDDVSVLSDIIAVESTPDSVLGIYDISPFYSLLN